MGVKKRSQFFVILEVCNWMNSIAIKLTFFYIKKIAKCAEFMKKKGKYLKAKKKTNIWNTFQNNSYQQLYGELCEKDSFHEIKKKLIDGVIQCY